MPCTRPIKGYRGPGGRIVTTARAGFQDLQLEIPCGQCIDCKIGKAADWAVRCTHELQMHTHDDGSPNGCFITLTYADEHLPSDGGLVVKDWQDFAHRLRAHLRYLHKQRTGSTKGAPKFRFFHVGEYGAENKRPHYHALIFGYDFSEDRELWNTDADGTTYFRSPTLEKLWPKGFHDLQPMLPRSINYVSRYVTKKILGTSAAAEAERDAAYKREAVDPFTGETREWWVAAEYATMSRRPGIGATWFEKYASDLFPADRAILEGKERRVPAFYTDLLKRKDEHQVLKIKARRRKRAQERDADNTPERRAVRNEWAKLRQKQRPRRKLD